MQVSATAKRLRLSPQKARLVVDQVRGKQVAEALDILSFSTKKGATLVRKVLESAIANAENNEAADVDDLVISEAFVNEGFTIEEKGRIVKPNVRSGLGIEINEAEVKKHPFQQELPQRVFYQDGSVGDW